MILPREQDSLRTPGVLPLSAIGQQEELARHIRLYAALSHINKAIVRLPQREELLSQVCEILIAHGGFHMAWIGWHNKTEHTLEPVAMAGPAPIYLDGIQVSTLDTPHGRGPAGTAFREGRAHICNDFLNDLDTLPWCEKATRHQFRAAAGFPIFQNGEVTGTLTVYALARGFFQDKEVALLKEVASDISFALENLQREAARKRAEEQRDRFFTLSLDMLAIVDRHGYFVRVNPAFKEALGYTEEELLSRPFRERVHPDDQEATRAAAQELGRGNTFITIENRYPTKDGRWLWLEWKSVGEAEEGLVYAAARDITQRKENEAQLQSMRELLELRVRERTSEILSLNQQLQDANDRLEMENLERQMALSAMRELASALEEARQAAENARLAAETASKAKSEFPSRMSHELRTPLNAILGFGQLLEMGCSGGDERETESIQQILKGGRHLLDLINEVLDLARIESGRLVLTAEHVLVGELMQQVLDLVRPLAEENNIRLSNRTSEGLAYVAVVADPQRLKQVFLNLISNAVKYNRPGGSLEVLYEYRAPEGVPDTETTTASGRLRTSVRDTGLGLRPDQVERLFSPFGRLDYAHSSIEGTGIGLSLCKGLVGAMNGEIGVESSPGQGSTFWVEFPLAGSLQLPELSQPAAPEPPTELPQCHAQRTILCIEDNLSNINLIEHLLAGLGEKFRFVPAMQASIGLDMARQLIPDLILLDVNLPDIMGDVVLAKLKADPDTRHIPVVMLSADATLRQIDKMLAGGALHYLTKPLDVRLFLKVLGETLG